MVSSLTHYLQPELQEKDRIVSFVLSKGSSFSSEIARYLNISVEHTTALINKLINERTLARIIPDQWNPQPLIRCRIAELWSMGIFGFPAMLERSWVIVTEKGIVHFAEKHRGEHRQGNYAYIEQYGIELDDAAS